VFLTRYALQALLGIAGSRNPLLIEAVFLTPVLLAWRLEQAVLVVILF